MFVLCEGLRPIKLFAKCLQAKREVEIAEHKYGYSREPFSLDVFLLYVYFNPTTFMNEDALYCRFQLVFLL